VIIEKVDVKGCGIRQPETIGVKAVAQSCNDPSREEED